MTNNDLNRTSEALQQTQEQWPLVHYSGPARVIVSVRCVCVYVGRVTFVLNDLRRRESSGSLWHSNVRSSRSCVKKTSSAAVWMADLGWKADL